MTNVDLKMYHRFIEMISPDYIFFSRDIEGKMEYVSPHVYEILGITQDQIVGSGWQKVFNLTGTAIVAGLRANLENEMGKISTPFEMEFIDHHQNKVIFEIHQHPFFNERYEVVGVDGIAKNITRQKKDSKEREELIKKLNKSLDEVKTLKGIIPICSYCKSIRNDEGAWDMLEKHISSHSDAQFSHGICPDCYKRVREV
jgi:PAS domain S-box-containing protein